MVINNFMLTIIYKPRIPINFQYYIYIKILYMYALGKYLKDCLK